MAFYLDTSALVKILHEEPESPAFRSWIRNNTQHCYTSDLTRVELMRAAGRLGAEKRTKARMILQALTLIRISSQICDVAGTLEPVVLRSLDAIHLATALLLSDDLKAIVTYGRQLANSAQALGIPLIAPGSETWE